MKYLSIILFSILLFAGCSYADEDQTSPHIGAWNLINTSGGIIGANDAIPEGEIIWDFSSEGEINIINTYEGTAVYQSPETGTYDYSIRFNSNGEYLIFDGNEMGLLIINGDVLSINSNSLSSGDGADGIYYEFKR